MNDWLRSIIAPIVVAVLVGMATSYLSTQAALAQVVQQVQRHEAALDKLAPQAVNVAKLEERMAGIQKQLDRIERAVEGRK